MTRWGKLLAALLLCVVGVAPASADVWSDYLSGRDLYRKKEYAAAYPLLLRAAQAGDARAQFWIGEMNRTGEYPHLDGKGAALWYRKAADQGHAPAQMALAMMLHRGVDIPLDRIGAYRWATVGAERMDGKLGERAAALAGAYGASLSEAEREPAKQEAAAWTPRITRLPAGFVTALVLWHGTGFFLNTSGTLLTNAHVAYMCPRLIVYYGDGAAQGTVTNIDFWADLATVQTDLKPSSVARFAGEVRPKVGTPIAIVGYPAQRTAVRRPLRLSGTVLDSTPAQGNVPWFQTSVPIHSGLSGSPALDQTRRVIGIAHAVPDAQKNESPSQFKEGQAAVIGVDSIHRFLRMTKTPFVEADSARSPAKGNSASQDFTAFMQCSG